ncbi:unnamed protein product [Orchesella dallaii]|uniref:33 kDa inner dynein arm light chain, axonemal n=1 Tax=Orchesella dallaii TaxID=48710 RepID=A0ABP1PXP9_9HEXA
MMGETGQVAGTKIVSLVKFDRPELLLGRADQRKSAFPHHHEGLPGKCGVDDGFDDHLIERCQESLMSQIETDSILNSIAPPREWEEEGKRYRQLISKVPASRTDILDLNDALNEQLTNRQARPDGICPIRRELADQTFDELIRQITLSQPERGLLLLRVRDELRMTLSAYQDLFVSSRDYDPYKNVLKESFAQREDMEARLGRQAEIVEGLQKERDAMTKILDCEDQKFKEKREAASKKHSEEFHFLKRVNNVLKVHKMSFTCSFKIVQIIFFACMCVIIT